MKNEVFIVDDHKMLLNGLKNYLEENSDWKVLNTCSSTKDCIYSLSQITEKKKRAQMAAGTEKHKILQKEERLEYLRSSLQSSNTEGGKESWSLISHSPFCKFELEL